MSVTKAQPGPSRYLHGEHILDDLTQHLESLGPRVLVITGQKSYAAAGERLDRALRRGSFATTIVMYQGECSDEEHDRIVRSVGTHWDVVLGLGGGKVLDLAKLIAHTLGRACVAIPTLPSNCAATTPVAVAYHPDGAHKESRIHEAPRLTIVDDTVLTSAPRRFFASGLGDTYAKHLEARVGQGEKLTALGQAGLHMADLAAEQIRSKGAQALADLTPGVAPQDTKDLFDTIFLLAGLVGGVGGSASRAAAAHAIHNGLTLVKEFRSTSHGEKVAYGLLVQSVLLNEPAVTTRALQAFFRTLGLPDSLTALGGGAPFPDEALLAAVAEKSLGHESPMHRLPRAVTAQDIIAAFHTVEELSGKQAL